MTDICETCGRGIGLNPDDSLAPPVDLSRCLHVDGLECRAVAQAKAFMRFDQQDAARDLLDAIATPAGRDFARAWNNATLMYGRYGQPPTMIDRWRDAVRDREAETLKSEAELDEACAFLRRIVRYHDEDKARTPGCTRLARVVDEVRAWLPDEPDAPIDRARDGAERCEECRKCDGSAFVLQQDVTEDGVFLRSESLVECDACNGTGKAGR